MVLDLLGCIRLILPLGEIFHQFSAVKGQLQSTAFRTEIFGKEICQALPIEHRINWYVLPAGYVPMRSKVATFLWLKFCQHLKPEGLKWHGNQSMETICWKISECFWRKNVQLLDYTSAYIYFCSQRKTNLKLNTINFKSRHLQWSLLLLFYQEYTVKFKLLILFMSNVSLYKALESLLKTHPYASSLDQG